MDKIQKQSAKNHYSIAKRNFNNPEVALIHIQKAIFLSPEVSDFFAMRGDIYNHMLDFKSAIASYRKAVKLNIGDETARQKLLDLLFLQGKLLMNEDEYEEASSFFSEAIGISSLLSKYWLYRAIAHTKMKDYEAALRDTSSCLAIEPSNAEFHIFHARLCELLGNKDQANLSMVKAEELSPRHPAVVEFAKRDEHQETKSQAKRLILLGNYSDAERVLNTVLMTNKTDVESLILRCFVRRKQRMFQEALCDLNTASKVMKSNGSSQGEHVDIIRQRNLTMNAMAIEHVLQGNISVALSYLNDALLSERSMRKHGIVAREQNRRKSSKNNNNNNNDLSNGMEGLDIVNDSSEAVRMPTHDIEVQLLANRGDCYRTLQDWESARIDYETALELDPSLPNIHQRLAIVYDAYGVIQFNERDAINAYESFSAAIENDDSVAEYYVHRGNVSYYQDNVPRAYSDFKRALELDPSHPVAKKQLMVFKGITENPNNIGSKGVFRPKTMAKGNPQRAFPIKTTNTTFRTTRRNMRVSAPSRSSNNLLQNLKTSHPPQSPSNNMSATSYPSSSLTTANRRNRATNQNPYNKKTLTVQCRLPPVKKRNSIQYGVESARTYGF